MEQKRPLAVRVLELQHNLEVLAGKAGAPSHEELLTIIRELAEGARSEIPPGWCPTCGRFPSLGGSTNLCGVCVMGRPS